MTWETMTPWCREPVYRVVELAFGDRGGSLIAPFERSALEQQRGVRRSATADRAETGA